MKEGTRRTRNRRGEDEDGSRRELLKLDFLKDVDIVMEIHKFTTNIRGEVG